MTSVLVNEVLKGFYLDSVALMRLSRDIAGQAGVNEAALMMGTPSNRDVLRSAGLLHDDSEHSTGGDLIIGIRAEDEHVAEAALRLARAELEKPRKAPGESQEWRPRSIRTALTMERDLNLALISVPGEFAASEARKAIRRGLNVMIFSDNVPLDSEAELKREARDLGLMVMGPDCGTSIINGVPLAFANNVPRGNVGIVGASGTGIQEISCLIARLGGGVSHAIGVGGRDMKSEVGGISTLMALDALIEDDGTDHIVVVSKPPPLEVAEKVLEKVADCGKSVTVCFLGAGRIQMPKNASQVDLLRDAAHCAVGDKFHRLDEHSVGSTEEKNLHRAIRGLFSGGTLCAEAQRVLQHHSIPISSNVPIPGVDKTSGSVVGNCLIDLGDDDYTRGRPHPMIDPTVRDQSLVNAMQDETVGIVLVDLVIGHGAHADPAGHLVRSLKSLPDDLAHRPIIIASVTGTDDDPQGYSRQVSVLMDAGIRVAPSNADAAFWAVRELIGDQSGGDHDDK